jgi:threonine 3-dehydrogenase
MAKLITGGSGQIGAELVHMLINRGEEVVVFDRIRSHRLADIENKIRFVAGDLGIWSQVFNVVKDNKITQIYHMGAILTFESEANPWTSFQTNVVGTYNVLEAARLLNTERMMFTSSIGTFDSSVETELTDTTLQRPRDFYGVGKLYGEGLGRMYRKKFGLDFRSIRYPSTVGPGVATPGHWDAPMIQSAILGKPYECKVSADHAGPIIYYKDAARAAYMVLQAPAESIKMVNYNVGGVPSVTPREIERALREYFPEAVITYSSKTESPARFTSITWDDTCARREWGWRPEYTTIDQVVSSFIQEIREDPARYGLS